jgi:DNA-binding transcriptional MerR regulator
MFTIGEFSRIARISPRQLRHYEALGLFAPEQIDPDTGYRFYSARQLPHLNRILALKELGLSLTQIQHLVKEEIAAEELRGMLTLRKAQLEQTIHSELARLQTIEARLQQIERQETLTDDVVLKAIPQQTLLSLRQVVPSLDAGFALMAQVYRAVPHQAGIGSFAVILHSESFETENTDIEMGFLLTQERAPAGTLADGQKLLVRTVPAVATMATLVCVGFTQHDARYGTLGSWIEQYHWQLAGPSWECFIEPFHPARLDEAIIEIQLPVIRAEERSRSRSSADDPLQ